MPGVRAPGGIAWVGARVLDAMQEEASATAPAETGGVLLGYWVRPWTEVVITEMVGGGPRAIRRPKYFLPDHEYQETEIAKRYETSGRQLYYLGDWHSHPGGSGLLSPTDEQTLRRIIREPAARCRVALMAVLAGGDPWELTVWSGELARVILIGTRLALSRFEVRAYDK